MNKFEMVEQIEENERLVREVYDAAPEYLLNSIKVNAEWTVRDELAHITAWLEEIYSEICFLADGDGRSIDWEVATDSSPSGYDKWNREQRKRLRSLGVKDLLDSYSDVSHKLRDFVQTIPDHKLLGQ